MKIFKKLLPVVIGLSLIIVIAITIVIVNATNSKTPKLSNGEESYLQFGNLNVTKQTIYDALKKDYGVVELTRLIDTYLYKDEIAKVKDEDLIPYIENDIFGEDFKGDKQKKWDDVIESLIITGVITKADADENSAYDAYTSKVWTKVKDYYRLQYAKEVWAKAEYLKRYEQDRIDNGKTGLFDDEDIEEYFEDNFGKTTTGLFIPFTSKAAADAMMKKYGINPDASKSTSSTNQLAGWVKSTYDPEVKEYPTLHDYLTPDEVIAAFIGMYNEVWAYTNNGEAIITSDYYTTSVSEARTLQLVKVALDEQMKKYATIKGDLNLPLEVVINGSDKNATIEWEAVDEENFKLNSETGIITVTRTSSKLSQTIKGIIKFGETTLEVTYKIEVTATSSDDSEKEETKTVVVDALDVVLDYNFTLNNDISKYSQFIWEVTDDSDYAAYLTSTSTKLTYSDDAAEFYKSYSVKLESVGDYYCLFIKLGEGEEPTLENSRDEVIQQMTEDLYKVGENEKANIERMYYVRRQESGLKIYDKFIEAIYEYNYNTFYSTTLSETDFDEYKTSRKNKKKIVAVVDGLEITPDQLFAEMEAKYGATYVKSYVDQYYIINSDFNTSLNPWKDIEDKDYIKSLLKSDISSFKQNFELDYFTYAYLAYYGYIPNFPASYGWKNFIHDYFGANSEKELLINRNYGGKIYIDVLEKYTESLYNFERIKEAMEKAQDEVYKVDVMNLIISVDYDYDGTPDTKIVESNKDDVTEENWTPEQIELAEELATLIMTRYDEVLATGTISDKLTEVVTVYKDAKYEVVNNPTTLEEAFGKYKVAGLQIKFEKSANYDHTSSLVEEFKDVMLEMWNYANDNGLVYDSKAAEDDTNYTNPIVEALKYNIVNTDQNYAFATSYGFHAVAVEKAYDFVDQPTEDEIKLYEASTKLTETQSSLTTAKKNLESASGNETAVTSYKEQIKQLEVKVDEYAKEVKELMEKLGLDLEDFDDENKTYTLDEDISAKCTAWYDSAKTEVETYIVEKELANKLKADLDSMTFAEGFNKDQLLFYIDYLLESYAEEK
jgi:hypothetical protein